MKKVTQKQQEDFIRKHLSTNEGWAVKGMLRIYEYQTLDEQRTEETSYDNGVGFTGADARILSSFSKQYMRTKWLSEKQMYIIYKRMPKYAGQLRRISDTQKLIGLVQKQLSLNI